MNNNINQKLEEILKKISPTDLKKIASSPSVSGIIKNLSDKEREKLISEFSKLSSEEIKRKINSENLKTMQGLSADEIIKRIKQL